VPIEGVADRMPERLRLPVNLDGGTVREGQVIPDLSDDPPEVAELARHSVVAAAPSADDLTDVLADPELREHFVARERPHPVATLITEFPDGGGKRWQVPHVFLACTEPPTAQVFPEREPAERAAIRQDPRWDYRELPLNHLGLHTLRRARVRTRCTNWSERQRLAGLERDSLASTSKLRQSAACGMAARHSAAHLAGWSRGCTLGGGRFRPTAGRTARATAF
jgi:hypothetical protein